MNDDGPGPGTDGGSPGAPFHSIADALEFFESPPSTSKRVRPGDTILVAPGRYPAFLVETLPPGDILEGGARGVTIRATTTFGSPDPITGTEARVEDPPPPPDDGPGIIIAEGGEEPTPPHPFRTTIDGFIIANWESVNSPAGGMLIGPVGTVGSSPTINNCSFQGNRFTHTGGIRAGGAISIYSYCRPVIQNCTFQGNSAPTAPTPTGSSANYGGAIGLGAVAIGTTGDAGIAPGSFPRATISSCAFLSNSTQCRGGAIAFAGASITVTGCVFEGNGSSDGGGAIFGKLLGDVLIEKCQFLSNGVGSGSQDAGGAILLGGSSDADQPGQPPPPVRIIASLFEGNGATAESAIAVANAGVTISHNRFRDNYANGYFIPGTGSPTGVAIALVGMDEQTAGTVGGDLGFSFAPWENLSMSARIVCNLFHDNAIGGPTAESGVVWLHTDNANLYSLIMQTVFTNNTVADHPYAAMALTRGTAAGGVSNHLGVSIENSILWNTTGTELIRLGNPSWRVRYTDSREIFVGQGPGNLGVLPQFTADYHLQPASPCANAGSSLLWIGVRAQDPAIPDLDLDGFTRIVGAIDMGAYELQ